jgi:ribosomal subunit interface protein
MQKKITFRGMDHSPLIEEYANEQLEKVMDFLENEPTPVYVNLILESGKPHAHYKVELLVKTPRFDLITSYEAQEMYEVLERVVDTMYRLLHEKNKELHEKQKHTDSY